MEGYDSRVGEANLKRMRPRAGPKRAEWGRAEPFVNSGDNFSEIGYAAIASARDVIVGGQQLSKVVPSEGLIKASAYKIAYRKFSTKL